ncbi:membrane assembly protein AsmA [Candidatus Methylacidiphilum infernorum]|uniref:Membrane assembly protein AsmA n=2 Tax=Candidatus Methylacidiphilum infernorum TaxID=511746 RepID=A0ABX7PU38_9BACT|nr:membrane assembly protein AsmA [Candidatus Methylacidiphilum infernorum]
MRFIIKLVELFLLFITTLFLLYLCLFFILLKLEKKPSMIRFMQSALTDGFGVPIDVEKIHFSFPLTVNLEKLKVENSLSKKCPSLFECSSIKFASRISPLHGLSFDVSLLEPRTSFELNRSRRLLLPLIEEGSNGEELPSLFSGKLAASLPIRTIFIQKGMIKVFSPNQTPFLMVEGIEEQEELDLKHQTTVSQGKATRVLLNSIPLIYNLQFSYQFSSRVFQNFDLVSRLSGGTLHLHLFNPSTIKEAKKKNLGWRLSSSGIKAEELFELLESHGCSSLSGILHCNAEGSVNKLDLNAIEGKGTFEIVKGKVQNMALFDKLSHLLKNASMKSPEFDEWKGCFTIKAGKILFTDMSLSSNSFSLVGNGMVQFDRSMEMDLKILLHKTFFKGDLPELFLSKIRIPQNSVVSVPVKISGTLSDPQVAFVESYSLPRLSPSGSSLLTPSFISK